MTKKDFERKLESTFNKFIVNKSGDKITYTFGFPKQTATIEDRKVAGISISFLKNSKNDKRQITINQIYHWDDVYQLLALGLTESENFLSFSERDIQSYPEKYKLKKRVVNNEPWEPDSSLLELDDNTLQYAMDLVKYGLITKVSFNSDKITIDGDYVVCKEYIPAVSPRDSIHSHMVKLISGIDQNINKYENKTTEWDSLNTGLFSKCEHCKCKEPSCMMLVCAYLEYIIKYGDLSMKLGERIRARRECMAPCGPYSFTWKPSGQQSALRQVPENIFQLAYQMVRDKQIEVSESLSDNDNVEIISHIRFPELPPKGFEITYYFLALYAGERKSPAKWDPPAVYNIDVRRDISEKGIPVREQIYFCAGYIIYLQKCGMQDLIDRDILWRKENPFCNDQKLKTKFSFTLPTDLYVNESDDMFELTEMLQGQNFISLENKTRVEDGAEKYVIVYEKSVDYLSDQLDQLKYDLKKHQIDHMNGVYCTPDVKEGFENYKGIPRYLLMAAYIDYLRKTGQYSDYTKKRIQHRKETAAKLDTSKSENPELEKVLSIAKNEADSSLYCIIEGERGAGQEEIVRQIASLLSQQGKLKNPEPTDLTFDHLGTQMGYHTIDSNLPSKHDYFMEYGELPTKTLLVLSGLKEFIFRVRNSVSGDGSKENYLIELLGYYRPQTFVIILAEENQVQPFLDLSSQIKFLFGDNIIPIHNMSAEKMYDLFSKHLSGAMKKQLDMDPDFKEKFLEYIALNRKLLPLRNQELAEYLAGYINNQHILKLPPDVYRTKSAREMLDSVIGMSNVKKTAYEFEKYALYRKLAESGGMKLPNSHMHMVFLGNPGTGKTMIARIMAEMLFSIGVIKTNKCIEVERKDLISQYVGYTAQKTAEVINQAMDGVLFVDEAYTLTPMFENDFCSEAIATLIKAMEDHQDRLVVIFAGYEKEMHDFLTSNPGLLSRVGYTFRFDDYSADELVRMFDTKMRRAGFEYSEDEVLKPVQELCEHFSEQKDFGNGRFVDRMIQNVILTHSQRESSNEMIRRLTAEDIPNIEAMTSTDEKEHQNYEEQLASFVGMDNIKKMIHKFAEYVTFQQRAKKAGAKIPGGNMHMIFTGNPGTGKTTIARIMSDMLFSIGAVPTHKFLEVERKDLVAEYVGQTAKKTGDVIERAMGGILFIDEAYTLTPKSGSDFAGEAIATLIKAMEDNKNNLIVIFAGYKEEMRQFKDANPGIASRIGYTFDFDDYSPNELLEIFLKKMETARFDVDEEAKKQCLILFEYFTKQKNFGNGRFVDRLIQETFIKHSAASLDDENLLTIQKEDIPEITDLTQTKKIEAVTNGMDSVIGMGLVKERLVEFERFVQFGNRARENGLSIPNFNMHMLFTGNPGTGKTMIARIIAQRLYDIGVIKSNNFVEVERKDLISEYVGQTAQKTADVIDRAMGGVLFIDEAYSLTPQSSADHSAEAIATLIKAMEDHKDNFIVIFAGYKEEMRRFVNSNPGIASRIGFTFEFEDYKPQELLEIFLKKMSDNGFHVDDDAKEKMLVISEYFTKQKDFGNGRFVDKLVQETIMRHSMNINDETDLSLVSADDLPDIKDMTETMNDVSVDISLDSVIGLDSVKERMKDFEHFVNFGLVARDRGLTIPDFNMHMLFTGNPGTGKTMIARIIAQRLYDIGVIKSNNFVEVERKDLVAEYVGQTAVKTADVIDRAMGGILFVDEAYTLSIPDSARDFGPEAIATLIKAMEDHKDNLIVIFAGYREEMKRFLNSNPGIASRIGFTFDFEDYTPQELSEIFINKMSSNGFSTEEEARKRVLDLMRQFSERENFGNGRFVNSVIQKALLHHAANYNDDNVDTIVAMDIPDEKEMSENMGVA